MRDAAQAVRTLRTIHCLLQKLSPTMLRPDEGEDCERADEQVQEKTEPASKEARCSVGVQTEDDAGKRYDDGDVDAEGGTNSVPTQREIKGKAGTDGGADASSRCDETTDTGGMTRDDLRSMDGTRGRLCDDGSCLVPPSSSSSEVGKSRADWEHACGSGLCSRLAGEVGQAEQADGAEGPSAKAANNAEQGKRTEAAGKAAAETSRDVCNCCDAPCEQLRRCSRCQVATYCSQQCQRWDWEHHKTACNRIKKHRASPQVPEEVEYIPEAQCNAALELVWRTACWLAKYAPNMIARDLEDRVAAMCVGTVSIVVREWFVRADRGRPPRPSRGTGMEYERAVLKDDFWRLVESLEKWQRGSSRKGRAPQGEARQELDDIGAQCIGQAVEHWLEMR